MADRTVKVSLILQAQGYMQGMDAASKKTRETGSEIEKLAQKKEAFNVLGTAAIGFGVAVAAGIAMAIKSYADFDAQMSAVQAATHETEANMELLRDAAIEAGARTVYSATEAAAAVEELAKAGISTADVLGGALDSSLDLAAAGNIAVADAAEIAASAMTQFGLKGSDVAHIADLLAAGAGKAQGGVSEMAQALNQSGLVAAQMGLSLDDTVGTLTQFASAGLLGSDAGTSFRSMLLRLANPTKEAATQMEQLGLDFYDSQGAFVGMETVAGQLQSRLQGLTEEERSAALANLFGQDAIRSASILYEGGAGAVDKWSKAVDDAGYAQLTAATRLDNLKGDWEAFTGSLDSAFISMGEGANGPLRDFVQTLTGMTNSFNDMPDWAQQTALGVGAVVGAVALASGGFLLGVPKVQAYRDSLATMGTGAQRAGRLIEGVGRVAATAAGFLALTIAASKTAEAFGAASDGAKNYQETLKLLLSEDLDAPFEGISSEVSDLDGALELLVGGSFNSNMERFGSTLNGIFAGGSLADGVSSAREQFSLVGQSLADMVNRGDADRAADLFDELTKRAEDQGFTVEQLNSIMPEYQEALDGVANSSDIAGTASSGASGDIEGMGDAAEIAQDQLNDLRDALDEVGGKARDLGAAQDDAQAAMNKLVEAAAAQDVSLWGTNDASIALRDSLRDVEEQGRDAAEAMLDNGYSVEEATAAYALNREQILNTIQPYFESRDAAIAWADANLGGAGETIQALSDVGFAIQNVPDPDPIKFVIDTSEASRGIDQWITDNSGREIRVRVAADGGSIQYGGITVTPNATGNLFEKGVKVTDFATGGWASGVGMARATPGGLLRIAEAGHDEAIISTDPKYRARSMSLVEEMASRLGMWQQPTISATPVGVGSATEARPINNTQKIYAQPGMSAGQVATIAADRFERVFRGT